MKCARNQTDVEPGYVPFTQKRHGIIVRAHEAGHPAVAKAPGIKKRPQIRFAIIRLEPFSGREAPRTICPVCKRRTTQVMPNFLRRWPCRQHALVLNESNCMIEIIDAIQWWKAADRELPVGPEY